MQKNKLSITPILLLIIAIIMTFFMLLGLFPVRIQGNSMQPLYSSGDQVWVWRYSYKFFHIKKEVPFFIWKKPVVHDIIIFKDKNENHLIKRVVATAGDSIYVTKNKLSTPKGEFLLNKSGYNKLKNIDKIPINFVLVIGDNIFNSKDSRELGLISTKKIIGKVITRGKEFYYDKRKT